jgi:hypothetical protein
MIEVCDSKVDCCLMQPTLQQLSLAGTLFEDHFSVRTKDNDNVLFFTFCEGGKTLKRFVEILFQTFENT